MAKAWHEKPLWEKVFLSGDRIYLHPGKIIGHGGIDPFGFFDAAKLLPDYDKYRYENAVRDLTVYARREASPPRYELTPTAKKVLRSVIGPEPTDAEYRSWWTTRLVSVKQMRDDGKEPEWATDPPVPLEPVDIAVDVGKTPVDEAPPKEKKKRRTKKKVG